MANNIPFMCGNCFHQHTCYIRKLFKEFLYGNDLHMDLDLQELKNKIEYSLAEECRFYCLHTLLEDCSEGYWKGLGEG